MTDYDEIIAPGAFGTEPQTVPVRVNFQGDPIGEATVYPDGRAHIRLSVATPEAPHIPNL